MKLFVLLFALSIPQMIRAQAGSITGVVLDSKTHESLAGVSILIFKSSRMSGGITNREGAFSLYEAGETDSIKFSAIGYKSVLLRPAQEKLQKNFTIYLEQEPKGLEEVVVQPMGVSEILHRAISRINDSKRYRDFENMAFYREIIKDSQQYYSVSEAVFKTQFFPQKKSSRLMLVKGRSKEDVSYTRLFEDFHPGGGPQDAVSLSFTMGQPDFLNEDKIKYFTYKKVMVTHFDGHRVYVLGFDQRAEIHEALESGRIFIDAETYSVLKYEARNSVAGTPYIKSLKGTDKIFAGLLHIDFSIKGWSRTSSYREIGGRLFLDNASLEYRIDYRQTKKEINLHLIIQSELMVTDFQPGIRNEIQKGEEWKRKDLAVNLPADFDSLFWGTTNILSPTEENRNMMEAISRRNDEQGAVNSTEGWNYLHKDYFFSSGNGDSMKLVALVKSNWEDNQSGGMIYKTMDGDFSIEAKLTENKRSNKAEMPENGFQQAGIIVRSTSGIEENNLIVSMGTAGNDRPKFFIKKTTNNKTKTIVDKTDVLTGWIKVERTGNRLTIYKKSNDSDAWFKADEYEAEWLKGTAQAGFSIFARFAGDGPKQHPDIKAVFSNIKMNGQD